MDNLITVREAAHSLKVSESTVYRLCARGLPHIKKSFGLRFRQIDLEEWLEQDKRKTILADNILKNALTISAPVDIDVAKGGKEVASKLKARLRLPYGSIYKRKDCDSWSVDYKTRDGRRVQKVAKGAITAEDALRELQKAVGIKVEREPVTFAQYAETYMTSYAMVRKKSWKSDKKFLDTRLTPFFGRMFLQEIRNEHVREFISERLKAGDQKNTVNRYIEVLRKMLRLGQEDGHLEVNPVKPSDLFNEAEFRRDRVMTRDEEEKLMEAAAPHLKAVIQFTVQTGCRHQEILMLRFEDVDFENGLIIIRPENNKTGKRDLIPMSTELRKLLQVQVKRYKGKTEHVFPYKNERTGEVRAVKSIKVAWLNACKRANITGLQFRDLRRTYATRLHEKGIDPLIIQRLLRHSSFKVSEQVYILSNMKMMKEAVEILDDNGDNCDAVVTWNKNKKKMNLVKFPFSAN